MAIAHRHIPLLAFIDSDFDENQLDDLRQSAARLAASREEWLLGAPRFIDETDEAGIRTVGIAHQVYAAFDDAGRLLDEAIDRKQLDEVRALVATLQEVSERNGIDLGLELDGESVGWIEQGDLSEDLRIGLLEAWAARFS